MFSGTDIIVHSIPHFQYEYGIIPWNNIGPT